MSISIGIGIGISISIHSFGLNGSRLVKRMIR